MKHMITRFVAAAALVAIMAISLAFATSESAYASPLSGDNEQTADASGPSPSKDIVSESSTSFNLWWD